MTTTLPSGWQPGDLLFLVVRLGSSSVTAVAQNAGTGTWTIDYAAASGAANVYYIFAHRLMQAGDTAPGFSWSTATTRSCYSCGGFYSDTGGTLALDKWATGDPVVITTATGSATPNPVTPAAAGEASIILTCNRASAASSATGHTYTPPSGWTWNDGDASFSASGLNARFAANCYKTGLDAGTVTPASESLTDTASDTFFWFIAHALVSETPPPGTTVNAGSADGAGGAQAAAAQAASAVTPAGADGAGAAYNAAVSGTANVTPAQADGTGDAQAGQVSASAAAAATLAGGAGQAGDAQASTAGQSTGWLYAGAASGASWADAASAAGTGTGTYATWSDAGQGTSAVLELSAFGAQDAVPAGAAVGDVTCVIRHGETPAAAIAAVTAQAYSGTSPAGSPQALTIGDAVHDDTVTFTGLSYSDLADLRVRVTVTRD